MIDEEILAAIVTVGLVAAIVLVLIPGAIWLVVKYIEFLTWAGNL